MLAEELRSAGPLCSSGVTRLHSSYGPIRHPLVFHHFPVVRGYMASLLQAFPPGTRRASPVAQRVLAAVPSLTPRRSGTLYQPDFSAPCCLHPVFAGSASGVKTLEVTYAFTFVTARQLARHPEGGFVSRLQVIGFPPTCCSSYRALAFALVGLTPTERASLRWAHRDVFLEDGPSPVLSSCRRRSSRRHPGALRRRPRRPRPPPPLPQPDELRISRFMRVAPHPQRMLMGSRSPPR